MAELVQVLISVLMISIFWIFSAIMNDMTLTKKYSKPITYILVLFSLIDIIAICATLTVVDKLFFEIFFPDYAYWSEIALNFAIIIVIIAGLFISSSILYKETKSSLFFVTSFYALVGAFFCDLIGNFVDTIMPEALHNSGVYYLLLSGIFMIVGILMSIAAYNYIAPTMKELIGRLQGNMKQLTILSVAGFIIYMIMMLILNIHDEGFFSVCEVISRASFIAIYITAYISIIRGIKFSVKYLELTDQMRIARDIQSQGLPTQERLDKIRGVKISAWMTPYHEVSGDYYDAFAIDDEKSGFIIADISGKGLPAAIFMMSTQSMLKTSLYLGKSPNETMDFSNKAINENNDMCIYYSGVVGVLENKTSVFTYACGGHIPPLVVRDGAVITCESGNDPVVGVKDFNYNNYHVQLKKGDIVFLYTDGVSDAVSENGERFGNDRLIGIISKETNPADMIDAIRNKLDLFTENGELVDDLTMLAFEIE